MNVTQKEQIIFEKAITKLKGTTGWDRVDVPGDTNELVYYIPNFHLVFTFLIKPEIRNGHLGLIKNHFTGIKNYPLLITRYVNPVIGEKLKQLKINYVDDAGNICIIAQPVYIEITGKKPDEEFPAKRHPGIFQGAGLQIIFALLCNNDLIFKTVRELAGIAGLATGTVHYVLNDLEKQGFIIKNPKTGRRLVNKKTLLDKWIEAYPENLRPKLFRGRYKTYKGDKPEDDFKEFGAYWGGETAAALMTNYLTPKIQTIFIGDDVRKFIFRKRLELDPKGELELMDLFWKFNWPEANLNIVPPILVYADLMITGDQRNIETAKLIYEKYLARYIENN